MKLIVKFWLLLLVSVLLGACANLLAYVVLSSAHEQQLINESSEQLESLIDKHSPQFTQELVNDLFFAVKLRSERIASEYAADGISVGLYRPGGEELISSPIIKGMVKSFRADKPSEIHSGHIGVRREVKYGNDVLATLWFAKPLRRSSDEVLQNALKIGLGTQVAIFILIILSGQQVIHRFVLRPLSLLQNAIPQIPRYLDGRDEQLQLPTKLGSKELNEVSDAMVDMTARVHDAMHQKQRALVAAERNKAIAQTTQMLAHDVRKPFTMLKMALESIENAKEDPQKVLALASELKFEAAKAMASVNGMISDVMEIGNSKQPKVQAARIAPLIKQSLVEVFRYQLACGIQFSYELCHSHHIFVDPMKIKRVCANIIDNARQVIRPDGKIWFRSKDAFVDGKPFVDLCISNDGPPIPEADLPLIFEAFFTSGKVQGTGLGLAICRRVAEAHGGVMACRNTDSGVEFSILLPACSEPDHNGFADLPACSAEVCAKAFKDQQVIVEREHASQFEEKKQAVLDLLGHAEKKASILIFEDDLSYAQSIRMNLMSDPELAEKILVRIETTSDLALNPCPDDIFDLIICDIDMGPGSLDGYEIVHQLRDECSSAAQICIHSNRIMPEDFRKAIESGADSFFPKPMTRLHLLDQLRLGILRRDQQKAGATTTYRPTIALIEDQIYMRQSWQRILGDTAEVHAFDTPRSFEEALVTEPALLQRLDCLITDYYVDYVDNGVARQDVTDFARRFFQMPERPPILLASNGEFSTQDLTHFDGTLAKGASLKTILASVKNSNYRKEDDHLA